MGAATVILYSKSESAHREGGGKVGEAAEMWCQHEKRDKPDRDQSAQVCEMQGQRLRYSCQRHCEIFML